MPRRPSIKKRVLRKIGGIHGVSPGKDTTSAESRRKVDPMDQGSPRSLGGDYYAYMDKVLGEVDDRRKNFEVYNEMDRVDPEIGAALDIYADNATQVGVTKTDVSRGLDNVIQINTPDEDLQQFLEDVRDRLRLDDRAWGLARDLVKMGEVFEEVVVNQNLKLDRLKQLPARNMVRNEDVYGILDNRQAFIQYAEDRDTVLATFEPWEIVHFRLRPRNEDLYGTSILHPIRRVFRQLQMIEDSMVVARLTRATSKLVYMVDTGSTPGPMAMEHVKALRDEHRKRRLVDPMTGKLRTDINPLQQEEDIFIGVGKGSQAGVKQLYGDLNIGNLYDVEYLQNKKIGGLHIPKSYVGVERDVGCLALDTRIPLLDGRMSTLGEIITEYESTGELPYTYSWDKETRKVVPGKVVWAGVTRRNAEVLDIELDDGSVVRATPDHKFFLLDGTEVEAKDLTVGEQLLPLEHAYNQEPVVAHGVKTITKVEAVEDTGDITVEQYENFFVADKSMGGILVHNSKANLTAQDIQFARTVRRVQLALRIGYNQLFDLSLLLEADGSLREAITKSKYRVVLPGMQTIDEMREWEVTRIQHEIARIGVQELYLDPIEVYSRILGYTLEDAKRLFLGKDSDYAGDGPLAINKNSAKSATARADKKYSRQTEALADFDINEVMEAISDDFRGGKEVLRDLRDLCDAKLDELGG